MKQRSTICLRQLYSPRFANLRLVLLPTMNSSEIQVFWVEPFLVTPALVTVKVSILLFYKRIFSLPAFKMVCNIMIAIVSLWGLSNLIVRVARPTKVRQTAYRDRFN